ncbi:MAG: hypothetical protein ACM4D3_07225, partial [Candidatus Sericytochromatia bacterium]
MSQNSAGCSQPGKGQVMSLQRTKRGGDLPLPQSPSRRRPSARARLGCRAVAGQLGDCVQAPRADRGLD